MPMKKTPNASERFSGNPLWMRISIPILAFLVSAGAILVPVLISNQTRLLTEDVRARYEVGTLATYDIRANETFHYIDENETKRRQAAIAKSVLPRFTVSLVDTSRMLARVDSLFGESPSEGLEAQAETIARLPGERKAALRILMRNLVTRYATEGIFERADLEMIVSEGYDVVRVTRDSGLEDASDSFERNLPELLTKETILVRMRRDLAAVNGTMGTDLEQLAFTTLAIILDTNVFYSPVETALARQEAALSVKPAMVRVEKGQYVLKEDHVITAEDVKTLQAMRLASSRFSPSQMIGRSFFVIIVTIVSVYAMHMAFEHSKRRYQYQLLFLAGTLLTEIALYVILTAILGHGFASHAPFLPVFALPILLSLVTNRKRTGLIVAALLGSYVMLLPSSPETTFFLVIAISASGIYFIRYVNKRVDMIFQWFFGIVTAAFLVLFHNLFNGLGFHHILQSVTIIALNISITYILVTVLLPLIEWIWNFPTSFRLRELAFSDSPVLVRLSQTAMGTYNHSMIVGELAYAAAQEIGADPLLARVGGMYHDIGKQEHPEYFIENQSGDNKHDDLKASLSVAIIKSHVKIGVEKAREAHLPQEVIDIISQHHGNDVIAIFLKEAQIAAAAEGSNSEVKQQDYSYRNQIPQSPEAAIVMLADGVEAASRTIKKPSAQKYEKLVNQIFMGKFERKQLVSSRLSVTDLERIAKVFVQILTGRYHTRIEYPQEKEEEPT